MVGPHGRKTTAGKAREGSLDPPRQRGRRHPDGRGHRQDIVGSGFVLALAIGAVAAFLGLSPVAYFKSRRARKLDETDERAEAAVVEREQAEEYAHQKSLRHERERERMEMHAEMRILAVFSLRLPRDGHIKACSVWHESSTTCSPSLMASSPSYRSSASLISNVGTLIYLYNNSFKIKGLLTFFAPNTIFWVLLTLERQ